MLLSSDKTQTSRSVRGKPFTKDTTQNFLAHTFSVICHRKSELLSSTFHFYIDILPVTILFSISKQVHKYASKVKFIDKHRFRKFSTIHIHHFLHSILLRNLRLGWVIRFNQCFDRIFAERLHTSSLSSKKSICISLQKGVGGFFISYYYPKLLTSYDFIVRQI